MPGIPLVCRSLRTGRASPDRHNCNILPQVQEHALPALEGDNAPVMSTAMCCPWFSTMHFQEREGKPRPCGAAGVPEPRESTWDQGPYKVVSFVNVVSEERLPVKELAYSTLRATRAGPGQKKWRKPIHFLQAVEILHVTVSGWRLCSKPLWPTSKLRMYADKVHVFIADCEACNRGRARL